MEAVEGHTLDEGDPSDEACILTILIASVADSESMINGEMQTIDECTDYFRSASLG
jgi:hypothetical protein